MFVFQMQVLDKQRIISSEFVPFIDGLSEGKLAEQNANKAYYALKEKKPELVEGLKNLYVKLRQEGKNAEEARIWVRRFLYSKPAVADYIRRESVLEKYPLFAQDINALYKIASNLEKNAKFSNNIAKADFSAINYTIEMLQGSLNENVRKANGAKYVQFYATVENLVPKGLVGRISEAGS